MMGMFVGWRIVFDLISAIIASFIVGNGRLIFYSHCSSQYLLLIYGIASLRVVVIAAV